MDHPQPRFSEPEIAQMARRLDRPLVLVGMMGVGKSSVGKRLGSLRSSRRTARTISAMASAG
jgi:shikimate kinase